MASGDCTACAGAPSPVCSGEVGSAPPTPGENASGPGFAAVEDWAGAGSRVPVTASLEGPRDAAARDTVCGFGLSL